MKNRKNFKILVVTIVFYLIIMIPIGSSYQIEKKLTKSTIENNNNYLGKIRAELGSPLTFELFVKNIFNGKTFFPPSIFERDYYFPEHNGSVTMNFSMILEHRLSWKMKLSRQVKFGVWVQDTPNATVYLNNNTILPCNSINWTTYNWNITSFKDLQTNGENKTLNVYFYVNCKIANLFWSFQWGQWNWEIFGILPKLMNCSFDITIHPI